MTHLSVNLNKIALLRNSRGKNRPSVEEFGKRALDFGVMGLTIHPRPDQRHARYSDLPTIGELVRQKKRERPEVEFNVEGYPSEDFLEKVLKQKPDQCTLVPDPPEALTSDAGWDFERHFEFLRKVTRQLKSENIRVSLFLDPFTFNNSQQAALVEIAPERIELYTEKFALDFEQETVKGSLRKTLDEYKKVAKAVSQVGIEVNAGHDLNQKNLKTLIQNLPQIKEVSIGHALIEEALWEGFEKTVKNYLQILKGPSV